MPQQLLDKLALIQNKVNRGHSVNINDKATKEEVIALVSFYFSSCRKGFISTLGESKDLLALDEKWQDLIRLAHGNNLRSSYSRIIKEIKKELTELNIRLLAGISEGRKENSPFSDLSKSEWLIIHTLEKSIPSAAASYRQGILDIREHQRLSYRGTASEFREALRETLDHLAPDVDVISQPGFKLERDQSKPTMKQKVRHILNSRGRNKTQRESTEKSIDLIESLIGEITRAIYNRASLATHVESTRTEVLKIKRYVDTVLFDILEIQDG